MKISNIVLVLLAISSVCIAAGRAEGMIKPLKVATIGSRHLQAVAAEESMAETHTTEEKPAQTQETKTETHTTEEKPAQIQEVQTKGKKCHRCYVTVHSFRGSKVHRHQAFSQRVYRHRVHNDRVCECGVSRGYRIHSSQVTLRKHAASTVQRHHVERQSTCQRNHTCQRPDVKAQRLQTVKVLIHPIVKVQRLQTQTVKVHIHHHSHVRAQTASVRVQRHHVQRQSTCQRNHTCQRPAVKAQRLQAVTVHVLPVVKVQKVHTVSAPLPKTTVANRVSHSHHTTQTSRTSGGVTHVHINHIHTIHHHQTTTQHTATKYPQVVKRSRRLSLPAAFNRQ